MIHRLKARPKPPAAPKPGEQGTRHRVVLKGTKGAVLWDIFPQSGAGGGAGTGFALTRLADRARPVLWVQDWRSVRESGRLSAVGMAREYGLDAPVIRVTASRPRDVLWAMEEGLRTGALAGVVGEIWGAPKVLDFTATKRLALRAETSGVPAILLRGGFDAGGGLSAARERLRLSPLPSAPDPLDACAPGAPRWKADLFRSRSTHPGEWELVYDRTAHRLRLSPPLSDGTLETGAERQLRTG